MPNVCPILINDLIPDVKCVPLHTQMLNVYFTTKKVKFTKNLKNNVLAFHIKRWYLIIFTKQPNRLIRARNYKSRNHTFVESNSNTQIKHQYTSRA